MNRTLDTLIGNMPIPPMAAVAQTFPDDRISDLVPTIRAAMNASGLSATLPEGGEVAVAVGSRGIGRLPEIVRTVVDWFRAHGARPFLVPAMGSHGGATADGQRRVLAELGVTEKSASCPIRSSMDVVEVGRLPGGERVFLDAHAAGADGIFVINRVKPHTAFRAEHESGVVKMITIGLGKQRGAASCHALGFGVMPGVMVEMARMVMEKKPVLGALAVVENAYDAPCIVEAVTADKLMECDARLLREARSRMPALPVRDLDVLILDEMGKNISGAGLDGAITGRFATPYATSDVRVGKLVVLDLTEESGGNATGMGNADIITRRLYDKIDFAPTYANAVTTTLFKSVFTPMVVEGDERAIRCALRACNAGSRPLRALRLRNTLCVTRFLVSPALLEELRGHPHCRVCREPAPLPFDAAGALTDFTTWGAF